MGRESGRLTASRSPSTRRPRARRAQGLLGHQDRLDHVLLRPPGPGGPRGRGPPRRGQRPHHHVLLLGLTSLVTGEYRAAASQADKSYAYDAYGNRISMTNTQGGTTQEFTYGYDAHGSVSTLIDQSDGSVRAPTATPPTGTRTRT